MKFYTSKSRQILKISVLFVIRLKFRNSVRVPEARKVQQIIAMDEGMTAKRNWSQEEFSSLAGEEGNCEVLFFIERVDWLIILPRRCITATAEALLWKNLTFIFILLFFESYVFPERKLPVFLC